MTSWLPWSTAGLCVLCQRHAAPSSGLCPDCEQIALRVQVAAAVRDAAEGEQS